MITAIMLFLKEKLFSGAGIFIMIFAAIFAVFIFSNSNVILSKFGFETTTTLKAEVTRLDGELKQLKATNDELNKTIESQKTIHNKELELIKSNFKEQQAVKDKVIEIKTKKEVKDRDTIKKLQKETVANDETITMPTAEVNKMSLSNITSLHDTFDSLFEPAKAS
jgi:hypothetical protein